MHLHRSVVRLAKDGGRGMRVILYRAKTKDGFNFWTGMPDADEKGEWVYNSTIFHDEKAGKWQILGHDGIGREVFDDSIGQFSGVYDKNGKAIFEDDIINEIKEVINL